MIKPCFGLTRGGLGFRVLSWGYRSLLHTPASLPSGDFNEHLLHRLLSHPLSAKIDTSTCVAAFKLLKQKNCTSNEDHERSISHILQLASTCEFDPESLCELCQTLAMLTPSSLLPAFLRTQLTPKGGNWSTVTPTRLTRLIWSLGILRERNPNLLAHLEPIICQQLQTCTFQDISHMVWGLAKQGHYSPTWFEAISRDLARRSFASVPPKTLSALVWGFATVSHRDPTLCHNVATQMTHRPIDQFTNHHLANILWSFATLQYAASPQLYTRVEQHLLSSPSSMQALTPLDVVEFASAFSRLGHTSPALVSHLGRQVKRFPAQVFTTPGICTLLGAFAKWASWPPFGFSFAAQLRRPERLQHMSCLGVAIAMHAFASLKYYPASTVEALCAKLTTHPQLDLTPAQVGSLLWSLSRWPHSDAKLVGRICAHVRPLLLGEHMSPRDVTSMLGSLAVLEYVDHGFCEEMADRMLVWMREGNQARVPTTDNMLQTLWALACLDVLHLPKVRQLVVRLPPPSMPIMQLSAHNRTRLEQVRLAWSQVSPNGVSPFLDAFPLPPTSLSLEPAASSYVQGALFTLLRSHIKDLRSEVEVKPGLLVDFWSPSAPTKVVEVEGVTHFFRNLPSQLSGRTKFKYRLLRNAGYTVYRIPVDSFQQRGSYAHPEHRLVLKELAEAMLARDK